MFDDELLEKFLSDDEMRTIPVGCQSTAIHAIERILEENGYELQQRKHDVSTTYVE